MSTLNDVSTVDEQHKNSTILDSSASDIPIHVVVKQFDDPITDEHSIKNVSLNTQENSFKKSITIKNEEKFIHPKIMKDDKIQIEKSSVSKILKSTSRILTDMKKRKTQNLTVNLYQFVNTIWSVFKDTEIDNINNKYIVPNNLIKYLNTDNVSNAKKQKLTLIINDESKKIDVKNYHSLMLIVVLQVMSALEKAGAIFQFSKEALKYFLSTYYRFIVPLDFMETNKIVGNEKKNKNLSPLALGGLLLEYTKGFDSFISNISRGDKTDILAFKLIMENKIELSPNIYHLCNNVTFIDVKYEVNDDETNREGYVKIPSSNFKRATVLITHCIVMVYDGNQFVIPPISLEKDIQMNMIIKSSLTKDEYILLDILLGTKNKVLDIIDANIKDFVLSENYQDRLEFLIKKFPDLKIITIKNEHVDTNYVEKKLIGRDNVSYIYYKPSFTAAVIGTFEKHAYIAFKQDIDTLVVHGKYNISGPMMFNIATASYQKITKKIPVIMFNDKQYKIDGDLSNINLLKTAIPVEIKDSNKLGDRSNNDISNVNDYKPTVTSKDTTVMDNLKNALVNPDNANKFIEIIQKSSQYDAIIQGLLKK